MEPITILIICLIVAGFIVCVLGYLGMGPLSMLKPTDPLYTPETDCEGSWSPCKGDSDDTAVPCKKTYTITTPSTDKGAPCPHTEGAVDCDFTSSTGGDCAGSDFTQCAMATAKCSTHRTTVTHSANIGNVDIDCKTSAADSLCSSKCSLDKAKVEGGVVCKMPHSNGKSYMIDMNSDPTVQTGVSKCETGWTMIDPTLAVDTAADSVAKSVCARFVESGDATSATNNKCNAGYSIEAETGNCIPSACPTGENVKDGWMTFIPDPTKTTLAWGTDTPLHDISACKLQPWMNSGNPSTYHMYCDWDQCFMNPDTDQATAHCCCDTDTGWFGEFPPSSEGQFKTKCPYEGDTAALNERNMTLTTNQVVNVENITWMDDTVMKLCGGHGNSSLKKCEYTPN